MTKRGIRVRQGPSRRASSIQSDKGQIFRFECGEFLRASQVITIFGSPDTSSPHIPMNLGRNNTISNEPDMTHFSECFAKLYRNSKHPPVGTGTSQSSSSSTSSSAYRSLTELATPGEWVKVHVHQKYYLEECPNPPSIARHFDGWRYHALNDIMIRKGPSFAAEELGRQHCVKVGESVLVNERVNGFQEKVTWLRLKDGRGWVYDLDPVRDELIMTMAVNNRNRIQMGRHGNGGSMGNRDVDAYSTAGSSTAYNTILSRFYM